MLLRRFRPLPLTRKVSLSTSARITRLSQEIDKKWQAVWYEKHQQKTLAPSTSDKPKFYCLSQFPYPSGQLHMGHVRVYTMSDCMSRLRRMQGYDVLHPMGWDAFGLPAENAAIERGVAPADWTLSNIAAAKRQMNNLGILFDWNQEVTTCQPDYYKWTQWVFLEFLKKGLAYRKEAMVNWDPIDQTVLANEQVDAQGRSWRSGAIVEQRSLSQWFLGITKYGDELLNGIDTLTEWPEAVKRMQTAWIGRSEGTLVHFDLPVLKDHQLTVFTTRVETLYGVSYLAICPEHDYMDKLLEHIPSTHRASVDQYIARVKALTKDDRNNGNTTSGVATGLEVVHPITQEKVPLYLAEYVLPGVGTGAVMGVPAHDDRDEVFAAHHGLESRTVLTQEESLVESGQFTGLSASEAKKKMTEFLRERDQGDSHVQYRLRDWLVSRQRYWGAPVPVIHCADCGPVGVPEKDLPVQLPELTNPEEDLRGKGGSPLARMGTWKQCTCPKCGKPAERDTDTLDTFVDSSWYFLRYADAKNSDAPFTKNNLTKWMTNGVDLYVGGIEHAILHLLYSRFVTRFLADVHDIPTKEPFNKLLAQGMVLGRTHKSPESLRCLKPDEVKTDADGTIREIATNLPVVTAWEKMSKSKYNGVDPEEIYRQYGADVARLLVLFKAPPAHELEWDEADLLGQSRWLMRIWGMLYDHQDKAGNTSDVDAKSLELATHTAIQKVTQALEETQAFNVAIAELMKLSNKMGQLSHLSGTPVFAHALTSLVTMLAPLAPHNASEMYQTLYGNAKDVHEVEWPQHDATVLANAEIQVVIQIRGKTRETISVPADADEATLKELALSMPAVKKHLGDKEIRKVIFVPSRKQGQHTLLNFVV